MRRVPPDLGHPAALGDELPFQLFDQATGDALTAELAGHHDQVDRPPTVLVAPLAFDQRADDETQQPPSPADAQNSVWTPGQQRRQIGGIRVEREFPFAERLHLRLILRAQAGDGGRPVRLGEAFRGPIKRSSVLTHGSDEVVSGDVIMRCREHDLTRPMGDAMLLRPHIHHAYHSSSPACTQTWPK